MPTITNAVLIDPYTIENITMSETWALPGQTKRVSFEVKDNSGTLTDGDSLDIKVKDPSETTRVLHSAARLVKTATGKYNYSFDIPADVIEGDWYVNISATIGEDTAIRNAHFPVKRV